MTTRLYPFDRRSRNVMTVLLFVFVASQVALAGGGGGGGLPWETPLSRVATSLTGPVALSVSLIALMVAGGTLVFGGELSEFARRSCVAVLAIAFLVLGAGFMTSLFGVGGATVL
jgi:type IV secretory pathway VirB2 component (pilin)